MASTTTRSRMIFRGAARSFCYDTSSGAEPAGRPRRFVFGDVLAPLVTARRDVVARTELRQVRPDRNRRRKRSVLRVLGQRALAPRRDDVVRHEPEIRVGEAGQVFVDRVAASCVLARSGLTAYRHLPAGRTRGTWNRRLARDPADDLACARVEAERVE